MSYEELADEIRRLSSKVQGAFEEEERPLERSWLDLAVTHLQEAAFYVGSTSLLQTMGELPERIDHLKNS